MILQRKTRSAWPAFIWKAKRCNDTTPICAIATATSLPGTTTLMTSPPDLVSRSTSFVWSCWTASRIRLNRWIPGQIRVHFDQNDATWFTGTQYLPYKHKSSPRVRQFNVRTVAEAARITRLRESSLQLAPPKRPTTYGYSPHFQTTPKPLISSNDTPKPVYNPPLLPNPPNAGF